MGKKEAPEYLDFYVVLGRANQLTKQKDSARYYYSHVLERNEKYEEAYTYWIGMELEDKNYDQAEILLAKARKSHPENSVFPMQQWRLYQDMGDFEKSVPIFASFPVFFRLIQKSLNVFLVGFSL